MSIMPAKPSANGSIARIDKEEVSINLSAMYFLLRIAQKWTETSEFCTNYVIIFIKLYIAFFNFAQCLPRGFSIVLVI